MNPNCARCGKIVYPTEKVNCLDKFWHKSCFHCETCKMTLNMKNYKGYEKKPYCNAHYPKQSFTMVADTPENLRLKQQSELQSQIKYHEEFERSRMGPSPSEGSEPERRNSPESGAYRRAEQQQQQQHGQPGATVYQQQQQQPPPSQSYGYKEPTPASSQRNAPAGGGKRFRAVYDYNAADEDEVSFQDGDTIINVQQIDDGWMYGTVERTGDTGMLPANYVEAI
uniref:LIM and SH3 domain protein 1 isoform X2 n=1 Tax=Agelaius phoeniceus TaxID=39638 RepID=UPI0023EDCCCC|nr:LIM and SH3 domain protein 1 isoform X2 [Agelaius phoeniceus]